tara:strand:- start:235 stop:975 length:741 start_codon:yes stop_codon:yes gene_type:complete
MTWIRTDFERAMNRHLNEAGEVKLKIDNTGYVRMQKWFEKNTDLLKPHNSGTVSPDSGVKHADKTEALKKVGLDTSFPYGYCYPISQFVFYAVGGYKSDYDLKLVKSANLKFTYKGKRGQTTHWFVQHKTNGTIIDLTASQFDRIPGINIMDKFPLAARANLGFPYYRTEKSGKVEFDHTPPCLQTLKLYDRYREDVEKIPGLEKYWSACNYATERRKGDENKPLTEMYDSAEMNSIDEMVRPYWS